MWYLLNICLCNDVVVTFKDMDIEGEDHDEHDILDYYGQSSDEITLIKSAVECGIRIVKKTSDEVHLNVAERGILKFRILEKFDFTSSRKRMSIVVQ